MIDLVVALLAGAAIGLILGTLGAGGSILAVPVLVHLLGADPHAATTGSLLVVAASATLAAIASRHRARVAQGLGFGLVAALGAVAGSVASRRVDGDLLLLGVSVLMAAAAVGMVRHREPSPGSGVLDQPIVTFSPRFTCACPRAAKVLATASGLGLLTGLFGVGGGFLVVPALTLALGLPVADAIGTSLVVIAVTSSAALAARDGLGVDVAWAPVLAMTATAALVGALTARRAAAVPHRGLRWAFAGALVAVAMLTGATALL